MLKHIVMWRFHENANEKTPLDHAQHMKQMLEGLVGIVPEILSLEFGIDNLHTPASYHAVLTVVVADAEALQRYVQHPQHQLVAQYAQPVTESRVCVDYIF